ncbi:unnamed protein product [Moneuplotes crassus]|uniref:USP domain-containing protein n=1 Tax=Euplotes crassus TaxID=5936 RepID=A0AAD1X703_EUPCR|nr:unnamed protein product [Moneuplotes crassus]
MEKNNRNNLRLLNDLCAQIRKSEGSGFENHALKCKDYLRELEELIRTLRRFVEYSLEKGERDQMKINKLTELVLILVGALDVDGDNSKSQGSFLKTPLMSDLNTILKDTAGDGSEEHKETVDDTQDDVTSDILKIYDKHFDRSLPLKQSEDKLTNLLERGCPKKKISSSLEVQPLSCKDQKFDEDKIGEEIKISNCFEEDKTSEIGNRSNSQLETSNAYREANRSQNAQDSQPKESLNEAGLSAQPIPKYLIKINDESEDTFSVQNVNESIVKHSGRVDKERKCNTSMNDENEELDILEVPRGQDLNKTFDLADNHETYCYETNKDTLQISSKGVSKSVVPCNDPSVNEEEEKLSVEKPLQEETKLNCSHIRSENKNNSEMVVSILMLLSIPELEEYLARLKPPRGRSKKFWLQTRKCLKKMHHLVIKDFKNNIKSSELSTLSYRPGENSDYKELDKVAQYILYLLENLKRELNNSDENSAPSLRSGNNKSSKKDSNRNSTIIEELFGGIYEITTSCKNCSKEGKETELFISIALSREDGKNASSFRKCIEKSMEESSLITDCNKCGATGLCTVSKRCVKVPRYLILSANQKNCAEEEKLEDAFSYPRQFYLNFPAMRRIEYGFKSVISPSADQKPNNYSLYCKNGNDWKYFDGQKIKEASMKQALNKDPVLLMYELGTKSTT